jgi:mannose-1-phosphate guanylyltransferase/mannose-6-phosphate isomerase
MATQLQPVVLCGGAGTRLWPLSREQYPKQLLALGGKETLLQATLGRLDPSVVPDGGRLLAPILVANEEYRFITAEQLRQAGLAPAALILEPVGRNTAPALTLAALAALEAGSDPVLMVMPADHVVEDVAAFRVAVGRGVGHAEKGRIVTFGVSPNAPETGYGYIRSGAILDGGGREIAAFVEKPDAATARQYLASGSYFWNAGMFMLRASVWLERITAARPAIPQACRVAFAARSRDRDFLRIDKASFAECPADSIDYAVMEKLPPGAGVVVALDAGWSDVGSWSSIWQIGEKDSDGNVLQGDVVALKTRDTLAISQSRLVACVGLKDAVIVETADAVLAADKAHIQEVKEIVARLKRESRSEADAHRKIYRPWGHYDSVDAGSRFQVKRIVVNPGAALSLQMHHHRAEHWVVVRGTARVTRGDETYLVSENESTFIPLGTRHRLENPGKMPLEIIEVQSGAYLDEDDIIRFDDSYGRK